MREQLPEIMMITSFPPRECGIATYTQDLVKSLHDKFNHSFIITLCPVESGQDRHTYADEIEFVLNTDDPSSFANLARLINNRPRLVAVMIQHEFGLFKSGEPAFIDFLRALNKPIIIAFHTVLPNPGEELKAKVQAIAQYATKLVVMTKHSRRILTEEYNLPVEKVQVIAHGTHLVAHAEKEILKARYELDGRKVLTTFGLLSSGKNIESTLEALPAIIREEPGTLFLIIGKTHPAVVRQEGESYREFLKEKVQELGLEDHVRFINRFLPLGELLEYLVLTDIYIFTSKDPNQTVSGTFSYAISCGCAVVSTPIPHALEVLDREAGVIVDFESPDQIGRAVIGLLADEDLRSRISRNGLHIMAATAWQNSAIAHAKLFASLDEHNIHLSYSMPPVNLDHVKRMTTLRGMIQFADIDQPDINSGYTLDDNARALIALCHHYRMTSDPDDLKYIRIYFGFLQHCQNPAGGFFNYIDQKGKPTDQNDTVNLDDSLGRAIWALGFMVSISPQLSSALVLEAKLLFSHGLRSAEGIHSTRSLAFILKGLYYMSLHDKNPALIQLMERLANRLVQMYRHEKTGNWHWFESYLTYANSILPEALLCAWLTTKNPVYLEIAQASFDFLLEKVFPPTGFKVILNKHWLQRMKIVQQEEPGGEQPIDVAYTVMALDKFNSVFPGMGYKEKMKTAFDWFQGNNHLSQVIYNPSTGGCYDGLEAHYINLNQGAESTVSYLMARLTMVSPFVLASPTGVKSSEVEWSLQ